jgi:uncharacterized protein YjbJ (UPF0337 family)
VKIHARYRTKTRRSGAHLHRNTLHVTVAVSACDSEQFAAVAARTLSRAVYGPVSHGPVSHCSVSHCPVSHGPVSHCPPASTSGATFVNKNQVKGRTKTVKGKTMEIAGKITGNEKLEQEGRIDQVSGKVESSYGDLKSDVARIVK